MKLHFPIRCCNETAPIVNSRRPRPRARLVYSSPSPQRSSAASVTGGRCEHACISVNIARDNPQHAAADADTARVFYLRLSRRAGDVEMFQLRLAGAALRVYTSTKFLTNSQNMSRKTYQKCLHYHTKKAASALFETTAELVFVTRAHAAPAKTFHLYAKLRELLTIGLVDCSFYGQILFLHTLNPNCDRTTGDAVTRPPSNDASYCSRRDPPRTCEWMRHFFFILVLVHLQVEILATPAVAGVDDFFISC
ncbi:hypothetical protein EVAR_17655_1 [Eumeta japonica]|uniref:Uncharacterized protein n=1 Tax=Eumeta variegata TaxID=151549 RepID=A0A4C1US21_EUMVA|nr:hypothetical protein EVAR_17655_1 [Eumeta japonica]